MIVGVGVGVGNLIVGIADGVVIVDVGVVL